MRAPLDKATYVPKTGPSGRGRQLRQLAGSLERAQGFRFGHNAITQHFGVKDAASAGAIAREADGVVVGSALVEALRASLVDGKASPRSVKAVTALVGDLAAGVRGARARAAE